jgi:hypothetical protein
LGSPGEIIWKFDLFSDSTIKRSVRQPHRTGVELHNPATPNYVDNEINSHQYLVVTPPHLLYWAAVANLGPLQGRKKSLTEELHGNEKKGRQEKEALATWFITSHER